MSQIQLGDKTANTEGQARTPILNVTDLCVYFKSQVGTFRRKEKTIRAVNGVSFSIEKSELIAIVGESGSGKTTLARCILGLTHQPRAPLFSKGPDITKIKEKDMRDYRRAVQIIYQDPFESLTPRMNVFDTLAIPLRELLNMKNTEEISVREPRAA